MMLLTVFQDKIHEGTVALGSNNTLTSGRNKSSMQKLTLGFTNNIVWLRINPATFFHALVEKVKGNYRNFVLESGATFERVLCSVGITVCRQQATLAKNTF